MFAISDIHIGRVGLMPVALIAGHFLICMLIGFYHFRKIKTGEDFSTLKYTKALPMMLVCTIFATAIGGGTIIGWVDEICRDPVFLLFVFSQPFMIIITGKIILTGIKNFKKCTTLTQVLYKLFGRTGKVIGFYVVIVDTIRVTSMQILAFGTICQYFFGTSLLQGMLLGIFVMNVYSILGGLRGIIAIDVFQFLIFFVVIPASYVFTIVDGAEFSQPFFHSFNTTNLEMKVDYLTISTLLVTSLLPEFSAPFMQRYLMLAKRVAELRIVFRRLFMISIPFMVSIAMIAYLIIIESGGDPPTKDAVFSYIDLLSPVLKGMMISGVFAILMSTADSFTNATSVILTNDLLKPMFAKSNPRQLLIFMRVIVASLSFISLALVAYSEQLFKLFILLGSFGPYLLTVPLSAAFLKFRVSTKQFLGSILSGVVCMGAAILLEHPAIIALTGFAGGVFGLLFTEPKRVFGQKYHIGFYDIKKLINSLRTKLNKKLHISRKEFKEKSLILLILKTINKTIQSQSKIPQYFGIFVLSYYVVFSLYLDNNSSMLAYLMVIGYVSAILLLLKDVLLPKKLLKYLYIYYFSCITFCLPVISSYMLFHYTNTASSNYIWVINALLSAFLLYQFLNSTVFLLSITVGFTVGYVIYVADYGTATIGQGSHLLLYVYLSLIIMSQSIAKRKEFEEAEKELLAKEKVQNIQAYTEKLVQELKEPTDILDSKTQILWSKIQDLRKEIKSPGLKKFKDVVHELIESAQCNTETLDNFMVTLRGVLQEENKQVVLLSEVIDKAVDEYKLINPRIEGIEITIEKDFEIIGCFNDLKYILISFMRFSYLNKNRSKGKIKITLKDHQLHYEDADRGVESSDEVKNALKLFFPKDFRKSMVALAFCPIIMENIGGSLEHDSSYYRKFVHFTLTFPEISEEDKMDLANIAV